MARGAPERTANHRRQPYLDSDMQSRWFDYGGDTIIRTDKYIRLVSDKPSRSGWLFSRVPLTATNWEVCAPAPARLPHSHRTQITFEYKIHGQGNLYGDGFAMWLTKNRAQNGPVFGSTDRFEGLGIFFDTYKNNRPGTIFPYIMAMNGDGNTAYEKETDGKKNELAGCSVGRSHKLGALSSELVQARGIRNAHVPTKARITFFQDKSLRLELQYKKEEEWTPCFEISDVKIPPVAYLGFSAETGELSDNHDIINLRTLNLYQHNTGSTAGPGSSKLGTKVGKHKTGGSWTWLFFKFILFGLAVAAAYVGFTVYRTRQRNSRF